MKTTLKTFINYIEKRELVSVRLLNTLKQLFSQHGSVRIEDIDMKTFFQARNAGKQSWAEFALLRLEYLKQAEIKRAEKEMPPEQRQRKKGNVGARKNNGGARPGAGRKPMHDEPKTQQGFKLRSDVIRTLKSIPNYNRFVEQAIIEKLERENIALQK